MRKKAWLVGLLTVIPAIILFLFFGKAGEEESGTQIICLGDSLTGSEFGNYPGHLRGLLKQRKITASIISAARPGNNSGEYLNFLKSAKTLNGVKPDLAIIMLGTNDVRIDRDHTPLSEFRRNMIEIIKLVKAEKEPQPVIFLASIPPIFKIDLTTFDATSRQRVEEEIVPCIRHLARQERVHYIDIHDFFLRRPQLMAGIHPRKRGYFAMAVFIFEQIHPFLEKK